ncbi:MAG: pantetheine-phosphate adenylyltransferase [Planctomycetes bacterium]|nr:pantetheine-phosphate adenylyltransferase [Planctomycetota bacterium]
MILLYPGSFDPPHLGHLDLIRRAASLAEQVVVGVGVNPDKQSLLGDRVREQLLRDACAAHANVRVATYTGATLAFARSLGARALLRGIRGGTDLENETTMATIHRRLGLDTVFLLADDAHAHLSGRAVRLARSAGLPLDGLVSPAVAAALNSAAR